MSEFRATPLNDGTEEDTQCARCGSGTYFAECWQCGGEGEVEDDDWQCEGEFHTCSHCKGTCGWYVCSSEQEWCDANPLKGREDVKRGAIEWFALPSREAAQ